MQSRVTRRLIHFSDIHFQTWPQNLSQLWGKRILGTLNLTVMGRAREFALAAQRRVLQAVWTRAVSTDDAYDVPVGENMFLFTGDLTAQSLTAEFELARREMDGFLRSAAQSGTDVCMIPGNHDLYTGRAERETRMWRYFGDWLRGNKDGQRVVRDSLETAAAVDVGGAPATGDADLDRLSVHINGPVALVGLNPCRAVGLRSSGMFRAPQLSQLVALLGSKDRGLAPHKQLQDKFVVLMTHYPILDEKNRPYHVDHPRHGVENGQLLLDVVADAEQRPDLMLHGHIHRGYMSSFDGVPILCPGATGQTYDANKKRCSTFHVYDIEQEAGARPELVSWERWLSNEAGEFYKEEEPFESGW